MRYAVVGYGRMGIAIDEMASSRGHRRGAIVDPARAESDGIDGEAVRGCDVAFEFSQPDTAEANVSALAKRGTSVVCGTTGWSPDATLRATVERSGAGVVVAPNFSVGVHLFLRIVEQAAGALCASGLYDPFIQESHHRGKLDAPSGTARRLAAAVLAGDPRRGRIVAGNAEGRLPDDAVSVASTRAGHEAGTHTVGFDGEHDLISLEHRGRGRGGLALGAVLAAEWLGGRAGLHEFEDILGDILVGGANEEESR